MVILVNLYTLGLLIQKKNKSSTLFILLTVRIISQTEKTISSMCVPVCVHAYTCGKQTLMSVLLVLQM